jgi:hypothetical protein
LLGDALQANGAFGAVTAAALRVRKGGLQFGFGIGLRL